MKMSRAERKSFNLGKQVGYSEGYAKGLYDGNPFNHMIDAMRAMSESVTGPEVLKIVKEAKEAEDAEDAEDAEEGEPMVYPVGTVKSVSIIDDDGSLKSIPLDRVIIERR